MITTDIARHTNKQPILLADPQFAYEASRHRFPNGAAGNSGELWKRNFVLNSVTYNHCEYVNIDPFIKGIPREVVRVTVGDAEYTRANSVHACDATFGSWFVDPVLHRLYVCPAINLPFDRVLTLDGADYLDETGDAGNATIADVAIIGGNGKKFYLMMKKSRHRFWKFVFSTAPAGGTRDWKYWDGDGAAWSAAINANIVAILGNVNLTATTNILHWKEPQADWDRNTIGDVLTVGEYEGFWIEVTNSSAYGTAGVGTQFLVAPVLEESIVIAWLEVPVGSKAVHIDGKYYMGRLITQDENMTVKISSKSADKIQEAMIGSAVTGEGGDLIISNADGAFDNFQKENIQGFDQYSGARTGSLPIGGKVPMKIGYDTPTYIMPIEDYIDLRSPQIEGIKWTDRTIQLTFMNQGLRMDVPLLQKRLSVVDYPRMEPDKEGLGVPMFWGNTEIFAPIDADDDTPKTKTARALRGEVVDPGKSKGNGMRKGKILFGAAVMNPETGHLHGFGTVAEVRAIKNNNKKSAKIKAIKYDLVEGNCRVDFKKKYTLKGEAVMLTEGYIDDPAGTFTGTANALITKPNDIAHFILVCICKYKTSEIDLASFTQVGVTKQGVAGTLLIPAEILDTCSVYVNEEQESARTIINRLMFQMDAVCQPNNEGKMQIAVRTDAVANTDPVLFRHHTSTYEVTLDTKYMGNVKINYRQIPPTDERSIADPAQVQNFPNSLGFPVYIADNFSESYLGISNPVEFDTYMITKAKADALKERVQKRLRRGRKLYKIMDVYGINMSRLLGEKTLINRARSLGGELKEEEVWLLHCERDHGKHTVLLEAIEARNG